jgi:hypothetical protein|tara:strand:+ start:14791 stop:15807 length:1017 start_codon:yes stop_codon:yes gene_type:complete
MNLKGQKMTKKVFIFIITIILVVSCDYKRDAIGGNDDIVVLAAKEDREKIRKLLTTVFSETILTPSPESFYNIKFADPESFSALKTQTNLVVASLGNYDLNPGTKLVKELLGQNAFNSTLNGVPITLSKDQFAKNQLFMILSGNDFDQIQDYLLLNNEFIRNQFDKNFYKKQSQYFLENERQEELELNLQKDYNWSMKIPWGWELIKNDSKESFFWIGHELPFRWIAVHWREGNFFSKEEVSEYIKEYPQKYFESIRYNQEYINIEFKDFKSESSYEVYGLWESIKDAKGGPFKGYVFYDYKNDRTFYISYLVFNPGGKKAFYLRQLEMIAKTITVNS